jgi:hypothetical protein
VRPDPVRLCRLMKRSCRRREVGLRLSFRLRLPLTRQLLRLDKCSGVSFSAICSNNSAPLLPPHIDSEPVRFIISGAQRYDLALATFNDGSHVLGPSPFYERCPDFRFVGVSVADGNDARFRVINSQLRDMRRHSESAQPVRIVRRRSCNVQCGIASTYIFNCVRSGELTMI